MQTRTSRATPWRSTCSARLDAFAIADRRDLLGATFSRSNTLDLSTFSMQALRANLDESLQLYADVIREPAFPPAMVEILRKQQLAGIAQEQADPFGSAWRIAPRLLYGEGHPYATPASGRGHADAVEGITIDQLGEVIEAGWVPKDRVSAGVDPAAVPVCA